MSFGPAVYILELSHEGLEIYFLGIPTEEFFEFLL